MAGTERSTWTIRLEVDEPDAVLAVAVGPDGAQLGFASGGPSRDPDAPTPWELYAVGVAPAAHGTGLAGDLVAAATGERPHTVWVLEDNARARAFYAKQGYADEGGRATHEGSGGPQQRLVRGG